MAVLGGELWALIVRVSGDSWSRCIGNVWAILVK
jgi:hypothetical protein